MPSSLPQKTRGFTLVELVVTMVVVSIAVLGISYALSFAFSRQSDGLWQAKSVALAESYLEEIMARRYDEVTPLGGVPPCSLATTPCSATLGPDGETRVSFDDVDDYDGLDDAPPVDVDGNVRADYTAFRVQVAVAYVDAALSGALGLDGVSDAKLVTVTVTAPTGTQQSYPMLRGNY